MKTSRREFIKSMNRVIAGVITMLGFAGCDKIGAKEYGTPHADYTVKGTVVNKANGKPIEGIRVGYGTEPIAVPMYGVIPTPYVPKVSVTTNAKGEFKLTDNFYAGDYLTEDGKPILPVYVDDIDGEENGLFQSEYLQVDFSNAERSGKPKGWYKGEYTVTLNVELTETEDSTDE